MKSSLKQYFIPCSKNFSPERKQNLFIHPRYIIRYDDNLSPKSFPKEKKKIFLFKRTRPSILPSSNCPRQYFFEALPSYYLERGVAQYSKKHERDFSGTRGSESHYATLRSSIRAGIRSMCYVIGIAGRGRGQGVKREEYTLSSGARVFDQDLSKGLVAPLWPAFRIGITCHCDQKRVSLATNINVPRDAAARSQCASQSL